MTAEQIASFEDLTSGVLQTETVPLQGGKAVKVQGISRYAYMHASKAMADGSNDIALFEARVVAAGLAEPKLSEGQVIAWQKSPGAFSDFQKVHERVMELSGLREGADKSGDQAVSD